MSRLELPSSSLLYVLPFSVINIVVNISLQATIAGAFGGILA